MELRSLILAAAAVAAVTVAGHTAIEAYRLTNPAPITVGGVFSGNEVASPVQVAAWAGRTGAHSSSEDELPPGWARGTSTTVMSYNPYAALGGGALIPPIKKQDRLVSRTADDGGIFTQGQVGNNFIARDGASANIVLQSRPCFLAELDGLAERLKVEPWTTENASTLTVRSCEKTYAVTDLVRALLDRLDEAEKASGK